MRPDWIRPTPYAVRFDFPAAPRVTVTWTPGPVLSVEDTIYLRTLLCALLEKTCCTGKVNA